MKRGLCVLSSHPSMIVKSKHGFVGDGHSSPRIWQFIWEMVVSFSYKVCREIDGSILPDTQKEVRNRKNIIREVFHCSCAYLDTVWREGYCTLVFCCRHTLHRRVEIFSARWPRRWCQPSRTKRATPGSWAWRQRECGRTTNGPQRTDAVSVFIFRDLFSTFSSLCFVRLSLFIVHFSFFVFSFPIFRRPFSIFHFVCCRRRAPAYYYMIHTSIYVYFHEWII